MMAFGDPRLDTIDDISALLDTIQERVLILGVRRRMDLTRDDVNELEGIVLDTEKIHGMVLSLRGKVSAEYLERIGH